MAIIQMLLDALSFWSTLIVQNSLNWILNFTVLMLIRIELTLDTKENITAYIDPK